MGEEDVRVVREAMEAFERGDIDAALEHAHPDLVCVRMNLDGAVFHGHDGFRQLMADWLEGFSEWHPRAEAYIDAGHRVIVRQHQWARGAGSGAPIEGHYWLVYTVAGGKIMRFDIYSDEREAFEAVGLAS
jgi:ketosteroid isomerase-like protein